jgi:hypothetical protein
VTGRSLLVQTDEYYFGFTNLAPSAMSFAAYVASNITTNCSTTWLRSGVDFASTNLTTDQRAVLGFALRGHDINGGSATGGGGCAMRGSNENSYVNFLSWPVVVGVWHGQLRRLRLGLDQLRQRHAQPRLHHLGRLHRGVVALQRQRALVVERASIPPIKTPRPATCSFSCADVCDGPSPPTTACASPHKLLRAPAYPRPTQGTSSTAASWLARRA